MSETELTLNQFVTRNQLACKNTARVMSKYVSITNLTRGSTTYTWLVLKVMLMSLIILKRANSLARQFQNTFRIYITIIRARIMKKLPEFMMKFELLTPSSRQFEFKALDCSKLNHSSQKLAPSKMSAWAIYKQIVKNQKATPVRGALIRIVKTKTCMALIIPNNCISEPQIRRFRMKFADAIPTTEFFAIIVVASKICFNLLLICGGRSFSSTFPLFPKLLKLSGFRVSALLNTEGELITQRMVSFRVESETL